MSILFIALPIVEPVEDLFFPLQDGVPGADWHDPGDHHLTLAFLGEVPDHRIADLAAKLAVLRCDQFSLQLQGVGHFPPRGKPKVLWAGLAPSDELVRLERKVAHAVRDLGLALDERKFAPHITLARLHNSPPHRVAEWLADCNLLHSPPWSVHEFALYRSHRSPEGSRYEVLRRFPLDRGALSQLDPG